MCRNERPKGAEKPRRQACSTGRRAASQGLGGTPTSVAGRQQILHQLEHTDDVPPLLGSLLRGRQILRQQENDCCEQSLSRIVKELVLPIITGITFWVYDGFR